MIITISASGISIDGPLVAGEKVAVSVSGLSLAAEDKPTLALLARFPDALLASVELAEDAETPGTWTGELDTATKQTALFFATARADERRDAALELVAGRVSLARLTVPMANSALCPKPDGSPFASPVYVPVPGPPGQGGDPYDQAPQMDGEASAGTSDEYARGDHRHPTDTSRMAATATGVDIKAGGDLGNISIAAALVQLGEDLGGKQDAISDLAAIRSGAAAGATAVQPAALATVATTGDYGDLLNTPTIPAAQVNADWNAASGVAAILNKPTIPDVSGKADAASLAPAFSTSSTYAVGDYVTHEGLLYKCATAVTTAGAWNAANWSAVSAMAEMPAPITVDSAMSSSSTNPVQNKVVKTAIDGCVPWMNANKNAVTVGSRSTEYSIGECTLRVGTNISAYGLNSFSQGQANHALGQAAFAEGQGGYACGFASHSSGRRVICAGGTGSTLGTPHDYAWGWQGASSPDGSPSFYHTHGNGTFNINPVPASGSTDPATGFWIGDTKLSNYVRYSFAAPTPSVSGTGATVACEDRAINDFTVATGITSLTITPPAAVTGRARDFFCRVTLTDSSLPTVTLSGGTIDIGSSEVAGMTQGVNLLMFTEIASGHWLASRRSAS